MDPDSSRLAADLSEALFNLKDYRSVEGILEPFAEKGVPEILEVLGRSYHASGRFAKAIPCFTGQISHFGPTFPILTLLGDCYYKSGDRDQAIRAWEKSLEMNPGQGDLIRLLETVRKEKIR